MLIRSRVLLVGALALAPACAPKQTAPNPLASAMASAASVYENDDDLEFVRVAAPATLKMIEILLTQSPEHPDLLLMACSGFAQYSYAFLHVEAEVRSADVEAAKELRSRAGRMYRRARGYCMHGLEVRHPGVNAKALAADPVAALKPAKPMTAVDVPWLYWTAASWGAELSLAPNQFARLPELAIVRALLNRAKALDDTWEHGAIYEALIPFDGLPPLLGGSPAAARADYDKAMQLSNGKSVFAPIALAATITNAAEKRKLLEQALAVDVSTLPARRLTNLIAQRYARALLNAVR